ncbi:GNAT family N-acetyltransferase [Actinoplanes sp. M2I2]|uniref:GNAT family N-acetyltransferase n=1 Tax=Actinoplanes sp. M2I2 TaxID=1734444 RepID=UPI0020212A19|nr:GNAT family N-acetyltransferase [Actinoplanes sp. M2I2]
MAVTIRAAARDDIELLLGSLGVEHHEFFLGRVPLQEKGLGEVLLAFEDGRPVGGVFLSWGLATEPEVRRHLAGVPMIFHLHVAPARRHRGIGRALLRRAEANLRARGHRQVLLGVDKSNKVARDLYLWLGFVQPAEPDLRDLRATPEPGARDHSVGDTYDILVADLHRTVPG